jgi:hypothetical protein
MPDDQALLAETIGYYHERLKQTPRRWRISRRGLNDAEMIERFKNRLCRPHAGAAAAGEDPQGRQRHPRPLAEDRAVARIRSRAF